MALNRRRLGASNGPVARGLLADLKAWWTFDGVLTDSKGSEHMSLLPGASAPTYTAGVKSLQAAGNGAVNSVGGLATLTDRSFWCWIQVNGTAGVICGLNIGATGVGPYRIYFQVSSSGTLLQIVMNNVANVKTKATTCAIGNRYFCRINVDATAKQAEFFVNEVSIGLTAAQTSVDPCLAMGMRADSALDTTPTTDAVDELGLVLTRQTTLAEGAYLYNGGLGRSYAEVVADAA